MEREKRVLGGDVHCLSSGRRVEEAEEKEVSGDGEGCAVRLSKLGAM